MAANKYLLNDRAMRQFITNGYIQIRADFPPSLHRDIYQQIETLLAKEGNPGNNILPRIPALRKIFSHPAIHGALQSILGPGYIMHPHRYCHLNPPGGTGQTWHKDDYIFDQNVRHHRCRWVMAFYYPQDVREDMGPTGILPGTQFHNEISSDDPAQSAEKALPLCGEAGTVNIVNFDSWHRATANTSDEKRYMLKFQFLRMQEPHEPSWNQENPTWRPLEDDRNPRLSRAVWNWLSGQAGRGAQPISGNGSSAQLAAALCSPEEQPRLEAAYALSDLGEKVVPTLIESLRRESALRSEQNLDQTPANVQGGNPADLSGAHALAAVGAPAVPELIEISRDSSAWVRASAADILGNIGPPARSAATALAQSLQDENIWVRRNAAEALGCLGSEAAAAVPALRGALRDPSQWVRLNAALSLAKIGPPAATAVAALLRTLEEDENRYTRFFATLALQKTATPAAQNALQEALFTSRWCPATTAETPY